jgi:hypothetical protein
VIHQGILRYRGGRYLWWAVALVLGSALLYATQGAGTQPSGDTWQGYVLGTVAAALVVWLAFLGVRKRRYSSTVGTVEGWTSAHVYLGSALLIVATLHSAVQVGWNVHTLSYVLLWLVVLSGVVGIQSYVVVPRLLSRNREGGARAQMFAELVELDRQARSLTARCTPAVAAAIASGIERTVIGGGVATQLFGRDHSSFVGGDAGALASNPDQQPLVEYVASRIPRVEKTAEAATLQEAVVVLCRRQAVLRRIRRDIKLQAWLNIWLYVHVPLTIALLVALVIHVLTTFMYW